MNTADDDLSKRQAVLATVFGFSQADLAANQSGELSAAQKERVSTKHYANSRFAWVAFSIVFGVAFLGFCADRLRTGTFGTQSLSAYVGVTVFFGLILWGFILHHRHQMKRTLRDGKTFPVKGKIQLFTVRKERSMHRYFCIDDHRFQIERYDLFVLLQQSGLAGQEATLYVSAPRKEVQSVELKT
ncbi:hypothetical protein Enr13x_03960 [Stieleria neptunia]|uniref:Uncharacterized protein n=1 Tax=Stieleria neptunia TaxID=2527979 RepID=A0A518HIH8_9BACT|nr:hypothetical protein [Stieleria neptunia]QDV40590.1 hypothetical protein Enr13x_03960 [Stieleria neptunia]